MNPHDPKQNPLIPAVEHLMGSLDADAQGVQRVADKLVGAIGDSLISDRNYLQKRVKSRIPRMVGNAIRRDERRINDMATPMRQAVAASLVSDAERVDQIAAGLPSGLPSLGAPTGATAAIQTGPCIVGWRNLGAVPSPDPSEACILTDLPYSGAPPCVVPPQHAEGPVNGSWTVCYPIGGFPGEVPPPSNVPPPIVLPPPGPTPAPTPLPEPSPAPPPVPTAPVDACGPLPEGLPAVAVYVVPWLDPGDRTPSTTSDCGRKLIEDYLGQKYPAQRLADALTATDGWVDYLGAFEDIESLEIHDDAPPSATSWIGTSGSDR